MFLNRIGSKRKLAKQIIPLFPNHKLYLEPFFGCGGLFFNKPLAEYNIVNDLNEDVINCFDVARKKPQELLEFLEITPCHQSLLKKWKKEVPESDIERAVRMVLLSNYTYLGGGTNLKWTINNQKKLAIANLKDFLKSDYIKFTSFQATCYKKFFENLNFRSELDRNQAFCYSDPPYLNTKNNYANKFNAIKWVEEDFIELLKIHIQTGLRFAISEFDDPFILEACRQRNLNVIILGERGNLKNTRVEILITNYEAKNLLL